MNIGRLGWVGVLVLGGSWGCGGSASHGAGTGAHRDAGADASDAGQKADAPPAEAGAAPISAPADQWTWVDFPDSKCASGTPTGIGVNPHAGASDVLIYLEGGGACYDAATCWGAAPAATNLGGYDATTFASAKQKAYPVLVRSVAGNPFAQVNLVYVPYCTGDLHAGTAEVDMQVNGSTKPTYFWGARDLDLFLPRIVATFPSAKRVWLLGTSAGGFGSFLMFDHVARAFGTRVDIIDDSGPPLVRKGGTSNAGSFGVWGFVAPAGCASPCNKYSDVLAFDRQSQPGSKFGFLSFAEDTTISKRYGYTLTQYATLIDDFSTSLKSDPNAATYVVTNEQSHVVESDPTLAPDYLPWLTQFVNDDPAWADVTFAHP